MAKDRKIRDQKRRNKLAKRKKSKQTEKNRTARQSVSLAYTGNKYKTEQLIQTLMQTEIGIYETFVMTDQKLLDQAVVTALETLIRNMRAGTLPPLTSVAEIDYEVGREEDLVMENIHRRWALHFEDHQQPPKDQLIGILRTILGSIETMQSPSPRSQGYLQHIAGFLTKKLGVSVQRVSADMQPHSEPKEDDLVLLGRQWILENDQDARVGFYELASYRMDQGQTEEVINACHLLLGEDPDPLSPAVAELIELSIQARQSLITTMG